MKRLLPLFFFGCGFLLFGSNVAADLEVDVDARQTWTTSSGGGWAKVTTFHTLQLIDFGGGDELLTLALRSRQFKDSVVINERTKKDTARISQSQGSIFDSLEHQGACLLLEGDYGATSQSFAGALFFFATGDFATAGLLRLNCPTSDICETIEVEGSTVFVGVPTADGSSTTSERGGSLKAHRSQMDYRLSRIERRGRQHFVMEEWALVSRGRVVSASTTDFGAAAHDQVARSRGGSFLVVQKPDHVMNDRWVPEPTVRLLPVSLPPHRQGSGAVVVARLEFNRDKLVDQVDVLVDTNPIDERWLRRVLATRLTVDFTGDKTHRTAAYVVLRFGEEIELLDWQTALPQCCSCTSEVCI